MTAASRPRSGRTWMQGVCAGAVAVTAPGPAIVLGALLAPALAGFVLEDTPGRPASRAMLIMGLAPCLRPVCDLLATDWSVGGAISRLSDPSILLAAWFCCGLGWLTGAITELAARLWLTHANKTQQAALTQERDNLKQEWTL